MQEALQEYLNTHTPEQIHSDMIQFFESYDLVQFLKSTKQHGNNH